MNKPELNIITVDNEQDRTSFYTVSEEDKDQRIDTFLASRVKDLTRSRIQTLIRDGHVKVNQLSPKTSYRLKAGEFMDNKK